ncbi:MULTISPECIES: DnaA regulatory inactivator Hda [Xanthomonas]|uniref:Replication related protein n=1 Tax=Xanthomonas campestris pv. campestris (strain B100) TaxID=509169 RepID=B0RQI9_XANCB|nr:DnaA regulatory inactivator Hda [Xanthomonas campestris]AEL08019.1 replication related protein [Xanthomonas campestris pv. raphani 756C]MCC3253408.1 DnaA regulatory inactivator Hda [Xanthomonas campestris pv. armoraciae]MCC5043291.1 DnaA regulatory inactivator Hda [Xanthomonas campestris]MCC5087941.1 DnaA regulatory inactivator Hda [Xanthomonas campestris]MCD0254835.1 DnaA regulatory inactivator Hda [Xanthomonas campestris pv. campestris]
MSVPQLPLALRAPSDQRLDSYIAAPDGLIAQLQAFAAGQLSDWLYLAGPSGTGKTHLALSVCAAAEQAGRSSAYLPLQAAAGRLRDALEALEGRSVVALDGVDSIAGQREDEVALFDFHNRARAAGITLLYTARQMPDGLALVLPDLRSRLSQCVRISLPVLDDVARAAVLRDRAQRRGLALDEAAIDWLLTHSERELAGLVALLDRLDRESLAAQRRVTVPFLRRVLGDRTS